MFRSPALFVILALLAGCRPPPPPEAPSEPVPEANPLPEETPKAAKLPEALEGVWATRDENGQPFDLALFPNGQAVTTWVRGPEGARGERGFWRRSGDEVIVMLEDGWTARLAARDGGLVRDRFAPGAALDGPPTHSSPAEKVEGPEARLAGVWRMNREPDGSYLYVALQTGGTAYSSVNGFTEGRWEVSGDAARCSWPDGWFDQIELSQGSWQKKSWVGGDTGALADLSDATRVGEKPFEVTP